jgi:hypothetical protein
MKHLRKRITTISIFLALLMINVSIPHQAATAAMIATDTYVKSLEIQKAKEKIHSFLARKEVLKAFINQGVTPQEAEQRIASLSDAEIVNISEMIDNLPAGGDAIGFVIGVLIIVLLVILIIRLA